MRLIFEYSSGDGYTYECKNTVPFEYESVSAFQYMVLDKIERYKRVYFEMNGAKDGELYYRNAHINILGNDVNIGTLEECIYTGVHTLDEWFDKNTINGD